MSRLPTGLSLGATPKAKRLSRQPSMDLRKRKTVEAPLPTPSKSTKTKARSKSFVEPRQKIVSPVQHQFYIGERVAVDSMGVVGTLKFLGEADFKEGYWAGIQLDILGSGKNDGSVKGIRYFACPPQTGLFVLASKLAPLDQDTDSERSLSPHKSSQAAKYIGLTASQLNQPNIHTQPNTPITSPVSSSSYRHSLQVQSPTPTHTRGMPSPAMTPTHPSLDEEMIADMRMPSSMTESPQDQLTRELKEDSPDDLKVQQLQLQLRVDVLEAENHYLKLENAQNKTAEKILERSLVLKGQTGQELFTLEGHQAIVEEIKTKHADEAQSWEQQRLSTAQTVQRLETRIMALETEQTDLITERDQSAYDISAARKEKAWMERHLCELRNKLAEAEVATAAAQAGEKLLQEKTRSLQAATSPPYFQPGLDTAEASERQMQLELEMEEVHQKMSSLRDAANAKDMFLNALSEQVELHRNACEEKEREIRRVKTEADRQNRDRERIEQELKEAEARWISHQDCPSQQTLDKVQDEYQALKQSFQAERVRSQDYQDLVRTQKEAIAELKKAGRESIELYDRSVEQHRIEREAIDMKLTKEHRKAVQLEAECEDLRKAGLETIEAFETTIANMKAERACLVQEQDAKRQALTTTVDSLRQEMEQLMNNAATEELREVWEKERSRLTEQVQASTEAYEKQIQQYVQLQKEADISKEQAKELDKALKDKSRMQEQLQRLQSDYDQQLASRSKYLEQVRSAVEIQQKAEGELFQIKEEKERLERDLQEARLAPGPPDTEKHQLEVDTFRSEIEKLKAQNVMLAKQKEQAEMSQKGSGHYQKLIDSLKAENKQLVENQARLEQAQKQTEQDCFRLTEEVGKLRQEEERKPTLVQLEGLGTDQKVQELSRLLESTQQKLDQLNTAHTVELRKLREKETSEEKDYARHVASLNRDISELESLIESKIFKEEELEEALDKERKLSRLLQVELQDLKDDLENQTTLQEKPENGSFCEMCEVYGHDLISCSKIVSVRESELLARLDSPNQAVLEQPVTTTFLV